MSYAKEIGSFLVDQIMELVILDELESLALNEATTLTPLAGAERLPDNDQWRHRFAIKSQSSNNKYIVAQHKDKHHWGCSCPGWKSHRKCKHLAALGLPSHEKPHEVEGT